jgi:hypothetical protein
MACEGCGAIIASVASYTTSVPALQTSEVVS